MSDQRSTEGDRLQKVLARAGVGSRRACEELIAAGSRGGRRSGGPGAWASGWTRTSAVIRVDGVRVSVAPGRGLPRVQQAASACISAMSDPRAVPASADFVPGRPERLFHVGRLDVDTEGLILLTNDGDVRPPAGAPLVRGAQDLPGRDRRPGAARPGPPAQGRGRARRRPGHGSTRSGSISSAGSRAMVEVVLHEGRNHIVRRAFDDGRPPGQPAGPDRGRAGPAR